MEEKIKEITIEELLQLYRAIEEHQEYLENEKTLFDMKPEIVVLNYDDLNYNTFSTFRGTDKTISYGSTSSDVKILNSKLYTKGTEATLSINSEIITVQRFYQAKPQRLIWLVRRRLLIALVSRTKRL